MKKLSTLGYLKTKTYFLENSRDLEIALYNYYFQNKDTTNIITALKYYQNNDGGFGNSIEPDFFLSDSSPMATSIGLRYLNRINQTNESLCIIKKAITYLENTFDKHNNRWFSVPSSVNDYPHAPWWEYMKDKNMTAIDYSWGNPTAEIIGYLYKYKKYLNHIDIFELIEKSIRYINNKTVFKSEHELYCFLHMFNCLDDSTRSKIKEKLTDAVSNLVNLNTNEWINYVPMPLNFIEYNSNQYFGIDNSDINKNLDFMIEKLENKYKIEPSWKWNCYFEDWKKSKQYWTGILTLGATEQN